MRQNCRDRLSLHDWRALNVSAMVSLKQLTQLAASSTGVWQVLQADASKGAGTDAAEAIEAADAKERAEIQLRRARNQLGELSSRLKSLADEASASPAFGPGCSPTMRLNSKDSMRGCWPRVTIKTDTLNSFVSINLPLNLFG